MTRRTERTHEQSSPAMVDLELLVGCAGEDANQVDLCREGTTDKTSVSIRLNDNHDRCHIDGLQMYSRTHVCTLEP